MGNEIIPMPEERKRQINEIGGYIVQEIKDTKIPTSKSMESKKGPHVYPIYMKVEVPGYEYTLKKPSNGETINFKSTLSPNKLAQLQQENLDALNNLPVLTGSEFKQDELEELALTATKHGFKINVRELMGKIKIELTSVEKRDGINNVSIEFNVKDLTGASLKGAMKKMEEELNNLEKIILSSGKRMSEENKPKQPGLREKYKIHMYYEGTVWE